ncbi:conserved hypothetical protein [Cupriavidus taiwanensis]|uniref:BD-FAE-like domain-containing protein n=1 Tax=Cupriavidus taiwanensis TaxID=164546 RepID=A0A375BHF9_9BURK|nr:alpha/beta hydrolase [Cupriavidus taiwanensis]SOY44405.1 conserved hypothetical protein [Cupriavidus taiwanensis]
MAFDRLPELPAMLHPGADGYAKKALAASRIAANQMLFAGDLPYGEDPWQKLDIYIPRDTDKTDKGLPVLFLLHGGAWMNGFKEWMGFMAPAVASAPAMLVSASYRLAPAVRMEEIVADCFRALSWVHKNIAEYGGDPDRVYVGGHSAGGHLAAILGLRPDLMSAYAIPSDVVKGCFLISAALDLSFLTSPSTDAEKKLSDALGPGASVWSPKAFVHNAKTPFYLSWGESDFPRTVTQNQEFVAILEQRGVPVCWDQVVGHDHFSVHLASGDPDSAWAKRIGTYLNRRNP